MIVGYDKDIESAIALAKQQIEESGDFIPKMLVTTEQDRRLLFVFPDLGETHEKRAYALFSCGVGIAEKKPIRAILSLDTWIVSRKGKNAASQIHGSLEYEPDRENAIVIIDSYPNGKDKVIILVYRARDSGIVFEEPEAFGEPDKQGLHVYFWKGVSLGNLYKPKLQREQK